MSDRRIKHGKEGSRLYSIWRNMKLRCLNPNHDNYHRYGGRGIKLCKRWHKFENFLSDMGEPPSDKHSIDRLDNNGNYTPENTRWATHIEQCRNRSANVKLTIRGTTKTAKEWAEFFGTNPRTVYGRIKKKLSKGVPVEFLLKAKPGEYAKIYCRNGHKRPKNSPGRDCLTCRINRNKRRADKYNSNQEYRNNLLNRQRGYRAELDKIVGGETCQT